MRREVGYVRRRSTGDCDDTNPAIHPDAPEICNNLDDDCDGLVDEAEGPEVCDGMDNDCNGLIDDGNRRWRLRENGAQRRR